MNIYKSFGKSAFYYTFFMILLIGLQFITKKVLNIDTQISRLIYYPITFIFLVYTLKRIKMLDILNWSKNKFIKGLKIGIPLILFCLLFLILNIATNTSDKINNIFNIIYWFVIYFFGAGLIEELMARGLVLNILWKDYKITNHNTAIISCLYSAFLFGCFHLVNSLGNSSIPVAQIIITIGLGMILGAIYIRTKNIWVVAFLHGLWDLSLSIDSIIFIKEEVTKAPTDYLNQLIIGTVALIPFVIIGLFMLRNKKINECIEN